MILFLIILMAFNSFCDGSANKCFEESINAEPEQDSEMIKSLCLRVNLAVGFFLNRLSGTISSQNVTIVLQGAESRSKSTSQDAEIDSLKSKFALQIANQ